MIFLFIIPAFAGLGELRDPADARRAGHGVPAPERALVLAAADRRRHARRQLARAGRRPAAGWTCYAPLCSHQPLGQVFFNMGVQWAGASSIMTALNFLVTIITMRAPGMTFWRMPLLVWANFTTSLLVVIATPFIAGSQFFVMFDRVMHTNFFEPEGGGYVLGYQHIFWFYSHPAVYIMMLPGFGIISEVISVMSRKPIFGYRLMALSLLGDPRARLLGLGAPHVRRRHGRLAARPDDDHDAADRGADRDQDLLAGWRRCGKGASSSTTPMLFALGFLSMFVIGGLSGIYLGVGADRHPRLRHVLHRRAHPLRALRRLGVHDLRRASTTGSRR